MNGENRLMKGTLLLVSADNLAAHYVGGYKSLSSALRKCRYCLATDADMCTKVMIFTYSRALLNLPLLLLLVHCRGFYKPNQGCT